MRINIKVEIFDRRMESVIEPTAEAELYSDGFSFTEGPLWDGESRCFMFNDIPSSTTYRWDPERGLAKAFENGTKSNGMYLARDGGLLVCEHATSSVVRRSADGTSRRVLSDHWNGIELNSPNDIVERSDGKVYFSDPVFGRMTKPSSVPRPFPSEHRAVYMYDPATGKTSQVASGYVNPNGLCFSADESILYVNDSDAYLINAYDVMPDGTLMNERLLAEVTGGEENHSPDGLKLDSMGNIVCAGQNGGIYWFDPDGIALGIVHIDPVRVVNFCWGGDDGRTMLLTCADAVYGLHTLVSGSKYPGKTNI